MFSAYLDMVCMFDGEMHLYSPWTRDDCNELVDPHTERRRCFVCVQVYKCLFQRMCIYNAGTDGDDFRNDVDN